MHPLSSRDRLSRHNTHQYAFEVTRQKECVSDGRERETLCIRSALHHGFLSLSPHTRRLVTVKEGSECALFVEGYVCVSQRKIGRERERGEERGREKEREREILKGNFL